MQYCAVPDRAVQFTALQVYYNTILDKTIQEQKGVLEERIRNLEEHVVSVEEHVRSLQALELLGAVQYGTVRCST